MIEAVIPRQAIGSSRAEAPKTSETRGNTLTLKEKGQALLDKVRNWLPFWKKQVDASPERVVEEVAHLDTDLAAKPNIELVAKLDQGRPTTEVELNSPTDPSHAVIDEPLVKTNTNGTGTINVSEGESADRDDAGGELRENLTPLGRALKEYPKKEEAVYVVGQHSLTEPIAYMVGQQLAREKQETGKPVEIETFSSGFDYSDSLNKALERRAQGDARDLKQITYEVRKKGFESGETEEMIKFAEQHPDNVVYNFHETVDVWETESPNIGLFLPPRLTDPASKSFKGFVAEVSQKIAESEINLHLTAKTLGESHGYKTNLRFRRLPTNMIVIEIHTPPSLYEVVDTKISAKGDRILKQDTDSLARIAKWRKEYSEMLSVVLPVLSQEYSNFLNPRFDLKTHMPELIS